MCSLPAGDARARGCSTTGTISVVYPEELFLVEDHSLVQQLSMKLFVQVCQVTSMIVFTQFIELGIGEVTEKFSVVVLIHPHK